MILSDEGLVKFLFKCRKTLNSLDLSKTNITGELIKDLSTLQRPLQTVLIIDDSPNNFKAQPKNGIRISQYKGDPEDFMLKVLADILELIAR